MLPPHKFLTLYIISGYVPKESIQTNLFNKEIPPIDLTLFQVEDFGAICVLNQEERDEIQLLWKELLL